MVFRRRDNQDGGSNYFFANNILNIYIFLYYIHCKKNIWLSVRGNFVGIHGSMIITVYPHLLMLSLLSEIVYNVLKKAGSVNIKLGADITR